MVYGGIGAGVLLLFFSGFYYFRQRQLRLDYENKIHTSALVALKSQMNQHFTFNSLQSIRYVVLHEPDKADDYLLRFSRFMRSVLQNSDSPETTLKNEVEELENYMTLEQLRTNQNFDYSVNISPELHAEELKVPSLILQPIVENAIVHGFDGIAYKGHIDIGIKKNREVLICTVTDNGKGRQLNKLKPDGVRKSMGTKITEERIHLYNLLKKQQAQFEIKDREQGVEVILTLPQVKAA